MAVDPNLERVGGTGPKDRRRSAVRANDDRHVGRALVGGREQVAELDAATGRQPAQPPPSQRPAAAFELAGQMNPFLGRIDCGMAAAGGVVEGPDDPAVGQQAERLDRVLCGVQPISPPLQLSLQKPGMIPH